MDPRKRIVRRAYDAIAATWAREREGMNDPRERAWLDSFGALLVGPRVLELGCGGGVVLRTLATRGLQLTGVDFSRVQLERARTLCPSADLVQADLAIVQFAPQSFDGIVLYDSLWHVPREEHGVVFERARSWVRFGAPLLVTVGALSEADERAHAPSDISANHALCGEPMFYAAWQKEVTLELLHQASWKLEGLDETPDRALLLLASAS